MDCADQLRMDRCRTYSMNLFYRVIGCFSKRQQAFWLYRRGGSSAKKHDHQSAIEHYTTVIAMAAPPADLRAMSLYNRALVFAATDDTKKAIADLRSVLASPGAPEDVKTEATRKLVRIQQRADRLQPQAVCDG